MDIDSKRKKVSRAVEYVAEYAGWEDRQYVEFLEEEYAFLNQWLSEYRKAYNAMHTMREPSNEFKYLAKKIKIIKSELKGYFPNDY